MEPLAKNRKRVREACDNCRRKKGRCPGERPICSLCARLGQECFYAGFIIQNGENRDSVAQDTHSESNSETRANLPPAYLQDQFRSLDDKVTEVLDLVKFLDGTQPSRVAELEASGVIQSSPVIVPSDDALREAARLYIQFCHCQPLPLFSPTRFETRILAKDLELRLSIMGTALRFSPEYTQDSSTRTSCGDCSRKAKALVMTRVTDGRVELSTLQSLCLLVLTSYNEDNAQSSGIYLTLLVELARASRLDLYARQFAAEPRFEEHVRCMWSIIMLQYLAGGLGIMSVSIDVRGLGYPPKEATNPLASFNKQNSSNSSEADADLGVVAYASQMTEAWYRVRQYIHQRGKADDVPPWSGQSIYSQIMSRQMELESQMSHQHRFNPSGFAEHPISVLSTNRSYWAPWLYLQLIYHAIVCTLNHPLFLSLHLRRFRVNQIPELFLQHIGDMITSHTDWFIHLLNIARDKQFELSDPFLGRCIAIVATIFLQQSYTEDDDVRADKRSKYQICLDIVQELGLRWSYIQDLAVDLQKFEATVSKAFVTSSAASLHMSNYVDMEPFWRIMDSTSLGTVPIGSRSIFGSSLKLKPRSRVEAEHLSTRLIPEPTRVHSLARTSHSNTSTPVETRRPSTRRSSALEEASTGMAVDLFADSPFLAQNFFALGQDFVGNADDWFNWTEG